MNVARDKVYKTTSAFIEDFVKARIEEITGNRDEKATTSYYLAMLESMLEDIRRNSFFESVEIIDSLLEEFLAVCVVCMQQNGGVRRGLGPVVERICSRTGYKTEAEVYALIDGERDYQDSMASCLSDGEDGLHACLLLLDSYLRSAVDEWTNNIGPYNALDQVRKLAAIVVRYLETVTENPVIGD